MKYAYCCLGVVLLALTGECPVLAEQPVEPAVAPVPVPDDLFNLFAPPGDLPPQPESEPGPPPAVPPSQPGETSPAPAAPSASIPVRQAPVGVTLPPPPPLPQIGLPQAGLPAPAPTLPPPALVSPPPGPGKDGRDTPDQPPGQPEAGGREPRSPAPGAAAPAPLFGPPPDLLPPIAIPQGGCGSCGLGSLDDPQVSGCGCACGGPGCVPGQDPCFPCYGDSHLKRFLCGVYQGICCPDPCYEPRWRPLADAAFWVPGARPVTHVRYRWDWAKNMIWPDRGEYFWARADGRGKGPRPTAPFKGEMKVRYHELSMYTETAVGGFGFFVDTTYRSLDPELAPHAANFGDMALGTKSMLCDCEVMQVTFQFKTYLPVGNPLKGLGTGHVSLEPSLLIGINLAHDWFLQAQVAEWIPLGGDPDYESAVLHYHVSLNTVLARPLPNVPLLGTLEMNGWTFQDGLFTDPVRGTRTATGYTYLSFGPGIRLVICDTIDFGVGSAFATTRGRWANAMFRTELRWRF